MRESPLSLSCPLTCARLVHSRLLSIATFGCNSQPGPTAGHVGSKGRSFHVKQKLSWTPAFAPALLKPQLNVFHGGRDRHVTQQQPAISPNKSATPQTPMSAPEKCFSQGPEKGHDVHQQHEGPSGSLGSHLLHVGLLHPPQHCGKVFSGNKAILFGLGELHFPTDILIDTIKRNRFERINSLVLIEPVKVREKS